MLYEQCLRKYGILLQPKDTIKCWEYGKTSFLTLFLFYITVWNDYYDIRHLVGLFNLNKENFIFVQLEIISLHFGFYDSLFPRSTHVSFAMICKTFFQVAS